MLTSKHLEKKLRQELGRKVDTAVPGWDTTLLAQLTKEQLLQFLALVRHYDELLPQTLTRLLELPLNASELLKVALAAGPELRLQAARRMLEQEATAEELADLILFCKDPDFRRRAAVQLLARNPNNLQLAQVILNVPEAKLVATAVARWDRQAPQHDLVHVLRYNQDAAIAQVFWEMLLASPEHTPTNISYVMNFTEVQAIRNQAAALLLEDPHLDLDRLSYVANKCTLAPLRLRACERILALKATNTAHLLSVIEHHPSLEVRTRVALDVLRLKPTSKHFKQLGADTIYAHMLCHCTDAAVCEAAWEKFRAIEPVVETFLELIAQKGTSAKIRQAAKAWRAQLPG